MPATGHEPAPELETPRRRQYLAARDLRYLDAAEAHKQVQFLEALPSASIQNLLLFGHVDAPLATTEASVGLLSNAARLYSENRVPLGVALQLLGRIDTDSARTVLATPVAGSTVLMDACRIVPHEPDLVRLLLAAGANTAVNASGSERLTALMLASRLAFTSGVRMLVEHSADVDQLDAHGRTALHHACETAATGPLVVLIAADATIHRIVEGLERPAALPGCR